jgi:rod shape-determining protein MreC
MARRRAQARLEMLGRRSESRRRAEASAPYITLAITLALALSLGVLHNRREAAGRPDPILASVRTALYPGQAGATRTRAIFAGGLNWLPWSSGNRTLADENTRLQQEVARLQIENQRLQSAVEEVIRLRRALGFLERQRGPALAAPVIGLSPSPLFDTLTIGRGTRGGVRPGAIVRTPGGLIGQISGADPFSSQVLLLSDPNSGVSAYVVRNGKVMGVGIVQGNGRNQPLLLEYLRVEDKVQPGDRVISSGLGGVVPADILIGAVTSVRDDRARALKTATVAPSASPWRAREVLVLL